MKNKYIVISACLAFIIISCDVSDTKNTGKIEKIKKNTELVKEDIIATEYIAGEKVYNSNCKACHQATGKGIPGAFPPLANSDYLLEDKNRAIKLIIEGASREMIVNGDIYNGIMTPQNIESQEIVDVMNYILNSWGNSGGIVSLEDVQKQKNNK